MDEKDPGENLTRREKYIQEKYRANFGPISIFKELGPGPNNYLRRGIILQLDQKSEKSGCWKKATFDEAEYRRIMACLASKPTFENGKARVRNQVKSGINSTLAPLASGAQPL